MRLIDADEFCRYTDEHCQDGFADLWKELIRRQPTAFDKEKVIKTIKHLESDTFDYYNKYNDEQAFGESAAFRAAAEIVEKGGIENEEM